MATILLQAFPHAPPWGRYVLHISDPSVPWIHLFTWLECLLSSPTKPIRKVPNYLQVLPMDIILEIILEHLFFQLSVWLEYLLFTSLDCAEIRPPWRQENSLLTMFESLKSKWNRIPNGWSIVRILRTWGMRINSCCDGQIPRVRLWIIWFTAVALLLLSCVNHLISSGLSSLNYKIKDQDNHKKTKMMLIIIIIVSMCMGYLLHDRYGAKHIHYLTFLSAILWGGCYFHSQFTVMKTEAQRI